MHRKTVSTKNDVMFHMIRRETIPNTNVTSTKQKVLQKKTHTPKSESERTCDTFFEYQFKNLNTKTRHSQEPRAADKRLT